MDEEDEVSTWQYLKDKGELISKQLLSRINFKVPTLKVLNANTDLLVQALLVGDESDEIVKSFKRGKWTPKLTAVVRLADCQLLQVRPLLPYLSLSSPPSSPLSRLSHSHSHSPFPCTVLPRLILLCIIGKQCGKGLSCFLGRET
jgi:hypothetical protein